MDQILLMFIFTSNAQTTPPPIGLPSNYMLKKALLLAEIADIQHFRAQIMSTLGKVIKFESTKEVFFMYSYSLSRQGA